MAQRFTEQLVIRVDPEMRDALERDADGSERTVSQSARRAFRLYLSDAGQTLVAETTRPRALT